MERFKFVMEREEEEEGKRKEIKRVHVCAGFLCSESLAGAISSL